MRAFGSIVKSSLVVFLLATPTSWADLPRTGFPMMTEQADLNLATMRGDSKAPPPDCENDRSVKACVGELLLEQDGMITEAEDLLIEVRAANMFSFAPGQFGLAAQEGGTCVDGECEGGPNDGIDCTVDTDCGAPVDVSDLFGRIDTLRNENARAKAANDATTDDEYDDGFAQADKEKGAKCKFSDMPFFESLEGELPPGYVELESPSKFGNGKCDVFKAREEVGGPWKNVNERSQNMCERVCEEKPNQQGKSKERFVDGMLEAISTAKDARKSLSASKARVSELELRLAEFRSLKADYVISLATARSSGTSDPCDPGPPGLSVIHIQLALIEANNVLNLAFDVTITALDVVLVAGNVVTNVLEALSAIMDVASDQTVAGFNARASAVPFTTAFHVSKAIVGVIDGAKNLVEDAKSLFGDANDIVVTALEIFNAFQADDSQLCTKQVRDDFEAGGTCVDGKCDGGPDDGISCTVDSDCSEGTIVIMKNDIDDLQVKAGETADALVEMRAELAVMKNLIEGNRRLLLTPPGRRDGYNKP